MPITLGNGLVIALAALLAGTGSALAGEAKARPAVVVELFTSEGCSSCPGADKVLADLARSEGLDVEIIPLGMHVDYWNSLGWIDPASSEQFSDRQRWYGQLFHAEQIYTPQMIVDGTQEFIGSDKPRAKSAIASAGKDRKGSLGLDLLSDPKVSSSISCAIRIDAVPRGDEHVLDVMIAVTEDDVTTDVPRGENAGRTLKHMAVVRTLQKVLTIKASDSLPASTQAKLELRPGWKLDRLHVVVFIQDAVTGRILGAASSRSHEKK